MLHYAQEIFEGLKAYKHADGSIWMFRPDANAERFQNSAKRLYLPELPVDDFIGSCAALVKRDAAWCPPAANTRSTCVRSCSRPSRSWACAPRRRSTTA